MSFDNYEYNWTSTPIVANERMKWAGNSDFTFSNAKTLFLHVSPNTENPQLFSAISQFNNDFYGKGNEISRHHVGSQDIFHISDIPNQNAIMLLTYLRVVAHCSFAVELW